MPHQWSHPTPNTPGWIRFPLPSTFLAMANDTHLLVKQHRKVVGFIPSSTPVDKHVDKIWKYKDVE